MKFLDKEKIAELLPYHELIDALRNGFREGGHVPLRHSHSVETGGKNDNSLLLMPCWQKNGLLGVKIVMVCPDNHKVNLESVSSTYILMDATTGKQLALLDGDELTARRTACASALASSYLSNPKSGSLLMMGTGKLAPHLIMAHSSVRDLENIYIWGRRLEKAEIMAAHLSNRLKSTVTAVRSPEKYVNECDIISCATLSNEPILKGAWLNTAKKQHIDLVGGFTENMREADDDVIRSTVQYVDTREGALAEAGDIIEPIRQGIIRKEDIAGDLFDMTRNAFKPSASSKSTMFKSVGTALEDLIAAEAAFNRSQKTNDLA